MSRPAEGPSRRPTAIAALLLAMLLLLAAGCGGDEGYTWAGADAGEAPEREGGAGWGGGRSGGGSGGSSDEGSGDGASDEGSSEEGDSQQTTEYTLDDYVEAALADGPTDNPIRGALSPSEWSCLVTSFANGVGVDRLNNRGITPQRFARSEFQMSEVLSVERAMGLILDGLAECADVADLMTGFVSMTSEQERCINEDIDERDLAAALIGAAMQDVLTTSSELIGATNRAVAACPGAFRGLAS